MHHKSSKRRDQLARAMRKSSQVVSDGGNIPYNDLIFLRAEFFARGARLDAGIARLRRTKSRSSCSIKRFTFSQFSVFLGLRVFEIAISLSSQTPLLYFDLPARFALLDFF